jgi:hypothetical protein
MDDFKELEETLRRFCAEREDDVRSVALLIDSYEDKPVVLWTNGIGAITHSQDRHIRGMFAACLKFMSYLAELVGRYCVMQLDKIEQINRRFDAVQQAAILTEPKDGKSPPQELVDKCWEENEDVS